MRRAFVKTLSPRIAWLACPWARALVRDRDGFWAFESRADAETARAHK